jgi:hypothetical protein
VRALTSTGAELERFTLVRRRTVAAAPTTTAPADTAVGSSGRIPATGGDLGRHAALAAAATAGALALREVSGRAR